MNITPHMTSSGKAIHILAPGDLIQVVESGERLRAYCPIHGGDHQRSLSIDASSGWGFCHCCHATVLIQDNRTSSPYTGSRQKRRQYSGLPRDAPIPSPGADPLASFPPRPPVLHVHAAITVP